MPASFESLVFDILTRDRASEGLTRIGKSAAGASVSTDELAKRLDALGRKSVEARVKLAGNAEALAQLDRIDAKLISLDRRTAVPEIKVEGAARTAAEIAAVGVALDSIGGKGGTGSAATATGGMAAFAGQGGMGAAIAAGVAFAPVIATVATGLAGFGLAAYHAAAPILAASSASGGLQANLSKLTPAQQQAGRSLLGLQHDYAAFAASLQPQVLGVFNQGLHLAAGLLGDIQPVAKATGIALEGMLGAIDREFRSQTWQQFFQFMARTAGPDIRLLTDTFVSLLDALPPLLQDLQPLAIGLLHVADAAAKVTDVLVHVPQLVGDTTDALVRLQAGQAGTSHSTDTMGAALYQAGLRTQGAGNIVSLFHTVVAGAGDALKFLTGQTGPVAAGIKNTETEAQAAAMALQAMATATRNVMTAQAKAVATQLAYGSAILTSANDAAALEKALDASHGKVGLLTAAQRASFGAAQTYIGDLAAQATQAYTSGHGVDAAMKAIRNGLPTLDSAKTKNHQYWQEVQTLVTWLDKLAALKPITMTEHLSGLGVWSLSQVGGKLAGPTGTAKGWLVQGGVPGQDSVPILAMPGEAIVPKHLTPAVAPFLKAHGVPGFAAGGIVPSYSGTVSGLVPWDQHNQAAFTQMFAAAMAQAMWAGIKAARAAAQAAAAAARSAGGAGGGGGFGAGAQVAQAFARSLFPAHGWSMAQWPPLLALWNGESGWNANARNPSSGAAGIPQDITGNFHGGYKGQVIWGENYIAGRYGSPGAAYSAWLSRSPHWYGSGGSEIFTHPTVIGVGERGPERVSVEPLGRSHARTGPLVNVEHMTVQDATDVELAASRLSFLITSAGLGS